MIQAWRIVENQANLYGFRAAANAEKALYLEDIIETTKPAPLTAGWDKLIAAPFRLPYFNRNILYCSKELLTALYEHAFHYLRERVHLKGIREAGQRTAFTLFIDPKAVTDIRRRRDAKALTAREDYAASHAYIAKNPAVRVIAYPSCRDPERGLNYAALDINAVGPNTGERRAISFYFDQSQGSILWTDFDLPIRWAEVA